ncbi:MAG: M1 family metallopeptidase [Solirubrobacterales bacterium]
MPTRRLCLFALCSAGFLLSATVAAGEGQNEPFFPHAGSRAYDAGHYQVELTYYPGQGGLVKARTRMSAVAERPLQRFPLDFVGPRVTAVRVDNKSARFERKSGKLWVVPPQPIPAGSQFESEVRYVGRPPTITDADGTQEGWYPTDDGVLAVGEPQGTSAWIPCNNVPTDKASFAFDVRVPKGLKAVANGRLSKIEAVGNSVRFRWTEPKPMSTYLAVLDIGRGRIVKSGVDGRPAWTLIDPRLAKQSRPVLAALPEIVHFESKIYGDYPFPTAGSIVDYAPGLGYALETQGRPIYPYVPDLTTVVHETAHQWFGDSVGLMRWPEIWLNEGFATWTEWYYAERHGRRSAEEIFNRLHRVPASNEESGTRPRLTPAARSTSSAPPST